jgi:Protein of unknown function (DUF2635)
MRVKPAPGRLVRDPANGVRLPDEGGEVPSNTYWHRRLKDGDVLPDLAPSGAKLKE